MQSKGKLPPHDGKELELLFSGEKKVALFPNEELPLEFFPYFESGRLLIKQRQFLSRKGHSIDISLIYVKGETLKMLALENSIEQSLQQGYEEQIERRIGELLGWLFSSRYRLLYCTFKAIGFAMIPFVMLAIVVLVIIKLA